MTGVEAGRSSRPPAASRFAAQARRSTVRLRRRTRPTPHQVRRRPVRGHSLPAHSPESTGAAFASARSSAHRQRHVRARSDRPADAMPIARQSPLPCRQRGRSSDCRRNATDVSSGDTIAKPRAASIPYPPRAHCGTADFAHLAVRRNVGQLRLAATILSCKAIWPIKTARFQGA